MQLGFESLNVRSWLFYLKRNLKVLVFLFTIILITIHHLGLQDNWPQVQSKRWWEARDCAGRKGQRGRNFQQSDQLVLHRQLGRKEHGTSFRSDSDSHGWLPLSWCELVWSHQEGGGKFWKKYPKDCCSCQPGLSRPHWNRLPDLSKPAETVGKGQDCSH